VNKGELINKVANEIDCTKVETKNIIECIFENITDCLAKGDAVKLVGFGTFGTRESCSRGQKSPHRRKSIGTG